MYRKLSKNGMMFIGVLCLTLVITTVIFTQKKDTNKAKDLQDTFTIDEVLVENQILKVQLLEFVSIKNNEERPTSQNIIVESKESISGINITNKQTFSKVLQLDAPAEDVVSFIYDENKKPSHNAYILVLIGDIIKYVDTSGKEKYVIENARVEYYVQAILLEEAYNSLYISSIDGTREKMVKIDDYKQAMSSVDTYYEMLQW